MQRFSSSLLEETRAAIEARRPIHPTDIDFNNPYFTQPRQAHRHSADDLMRSVAGEPIRHVYVHVPFCATRCVYCHYPTVTNLHSDENQSRFVAQVQDEIRHYRNSGLDLANVLSVHVGGGTPNCLSERHLGALLETLGNSFQPSHEFGVEVYPSRRDFDEAKLKRMRKAGVTRLSIGVQTFADAVNEQNRRIDQPREYVVHAIATAQDHFDNVSIDLLYGQKGQDLAVLEEDCATVSDLRINSIYLYQTREQIHRPGVDLQIALNLFLSFFSDHGYEIVSFDQVILKRNTNGFSTHRSGRSLSENLLGIGPGAVSEIGSFIFRNRNPSDYATSGFGVEPGAVIRRSDRVRRAEFVNRALRHFNDPNVNGLQLGAYQARFGTHVHDDLGPELECMRELGLIHYDDDIIEITDLGMHFTQQINYYLLGHYK
jgi:coproporphyrinogen III oxidase-like Fe-S oxidoreductase